MMRPAAQRPLPLVASFVMAMAGVAILVQGWTILATRGSPIALIPGAAHAGLARPAPADADYAAAFASAFLEAWFAWTDSSFAAHRSSAMQMMAPALRVRSEAADERRMITLLCACQTWSEEQLSVRRLAPGPGAVRFAVRFQGTIQRYFAGLGGGPGDRAAGLLMLDGKPLDPEHPFALQVAAFTAALGKG